MNTDSSLLGSELELQQQEEIYQQLLMQTVGKMPTENPESKVIRPQPGLCVKTVTEPDKQKIFVNVCQSPVVPLPPEISRDELVDLLQSEDPSGFRVPMSLGEPHTETDNNSQACTAYDVVINQEFFQKCQVQLHCCSYKRSSRSLVLDLGEDRLLLTARPSLYLLDIFHPFSIEQESSVAQFNSNTQILTVTMPVVSS
ncbi:hypothetical protein F7725_004076 [Dissostichus mawsoni]|uniref:PIH1 domain-containing protein 1 n=1 Tax=Dissostichus mawsoni TaxID=36200 RepID=A0A7J5YFC4_DISMA|nr:hypothetical protein F7725_004076 [Dissostichus mawsoni]